MPKIILKTDMPDKAVEIISEALETESLRLKYSLQLSKKRLSKFEKKYQISSEMFMDEWSAEDLEGKDLEYVEWAGEYHLSKRLSERLDALKSIRHVSS
ncbi:hypothetical protein Dvar_30740 [Desulfosarcina variabilis str. Montpellier]|uniref:hypothetical protein n=1 Tax=Desulfosarcina variabilis TaxID=2300 RepID=UPI003AFB7D6E